MDVSNHLIPDSEEQKRINSLLEKLILKKREVERIRQVFQDELENGLREAPSSLQMENTYIPELPNGTEEGQFLALDLGGTNFRVILTEFVKGKIVELTVKHYQMSEELRLGSGAALFDYIAECVKDFLKENQLTEVNISLGFTFSFPIIQHSLSSGVLLSWTKSFKCEDVVGEDVVQLLSKALIKKGCSNLTVNAILNDTTGTLMMGALIDPNTSIGLIIGTGSNACYLERADRVRHWETVRHGEKEVIIDVEWGAFGDNGLLDFIKTEFDVQVDENSLLSRTFTFEKYISGKYLGEIVRIVLVKLVDEGLLFGGRGSNNLTTPDSFPSAYISDIEEDRVNGSLNKTQRILKELNISHCGKDDLNLLRHVCTIVSNRSALLVATCLSALIERVGKEEVTIAVDGSVYIKHPSYRFQLEKYLREMTKKKFKFLPVTDGSGKGAAVTVAIANKLIEIYKGS